jgi:3-phenylpropionate/trans-cinnamate dioxygenase ferredoxin reductase component
MVDSVLVIGASVAGVGAANELRRCGFSGRITLVDGQAHLPYDRPPLSKGALYGQDTIPDLQFHDRDYYARMNIDLQLGTGAQMLDLDTRTVFLESGQRLSADRIIVATGARARPFPPNRCAGTVHLLRDQEDAMRLRALLRRDKSFVVIGGGFIGAEVASAAARLGLNVVVVEAARLPFERILGSQVAARLARLHVEAGVELLCGVSVERIESSDNGQRVFLAGDLQIDADVVVAGLGSVPNVEWLASSGLEISNGILCDEQGRTGSLGIFAAGDVSAWRDPFNGQHIRHEHWTAAREQARIVAQSISGGLVTPWRDFVPYFWSDLYGIRLQMLGSAVGADDIRIVHQDEEKRAFVAEYRKAGELTAVVGSNAGARTMRYASKLTRNAVSEGSDA